MKVAVCFFLLFLLTDCYRDGRGVVIAAHDISAQTVIEGTDLEYVNASNVYKQRGSLPAHTLRDRRDVIGHKAIHSLPKGSPLNSRDID